MATDTADEEIRNVAARWAQRLADRTDLTEAEREDFQRWLMADESHQRELRAHTVILNLASALPEARAELLAIEAAPRRGLQRPAWIAGLAASVVLMLGLAGWLAYRYQAVPTTHITQTGATRSVTLPDGSSALLNTRTELRWIGRADERRVALLEGEATFDVRPDPAKPFTVVLDASQIRVVGTRFNVRRRENTETVVTVLQGAVTVSQERVSAGTQAPWSRTLHANEQIVYAATGLVRDVHSADGANASLWRKGILEFDDEPLSNIVSDLGRYTERQILIRDARLAQLRLGGQLNLHDQIEDSLGPLEKLAPVSIDHVGDTLVLDYRGDATAERD